MSETSFKLDFSQFDEQMKMIVQTTVPEYTSRGLFNAAAELLNDADNIPPKTPKLSGDLKGSKTIAIKNVAKRGKKAGIKHYDEDYSAGVSARVLAGFNVPYAARWHEVAPTKKINWSEPGSGPKYLESKMSMFRSKYMRIVAETIKEESK